MVDRSVFAHITAACLNGCVHVDISLTGCLVEKGWRSDIIGIVQVILIVKAGGKCGSFSSTRKNRSSSSISK